MDSIQDQGSTLNIWHLKDAQTIGINWVNGNIAEWTEKAYRLAKQYVIWREHKLEIEGGVERNEYGATVTMCIKQDGKRFFHCFPSTNGWEDLMVNDLQRSKRIVTVCISGPISVD